LPYGCPGGLTDDHASHDSEHDRGHLRTRAHCVERDRADDRTGKHCKTSSADPQSAISPAMVVFTQKAAAKRAGGHLSPLTPRCRLDLTDSIVRGGLRYHRPASVTLPRGYDAAHHTCHEGFVMLPESDGLCLGESAECSG
jgi:hypothetical protein